VTGRVDRADHRWILEAIEDHADPPACLTAWPASGGRWLY